MSVKFEEIFKNDLEKVIKVILKNAFYDGLEKLFSKDIEEIISRIYGDDTRIRLYYDLDTLSLIEFSLIGIKSKLNGILQKLLRERKQDILKYALFSSWAKFAIANFFGVHIRNEGRIEEEIEEKIFEEKIDLSKFEMDFDINKFINMEFSKELVIQFLLEKVIKSVSLPRKIQLEIKNYLPEVELVRKDTSKEESYLFKITPIQISMDLEKLLNEINKLKLANYMYKKFIPKILYSLIISAALNRNEKIVVEDVGVKYFGALLKNKEIFVKGEIKEEEAFYYGKNLKIFLENPLNIFKISKTLKDSKIILKSFRGIISQIFDILKRNDVEIEKGPGELFLLYNFVKKYVNLKSLTIRNIITVPGCVYLRYYVRLLDVLCELWDAVTPKDPDVFWDNYVIKLGEEMEKYVASKDFDIPPKVFLRSIHSIPEEDFYNMFLVYLFEIESYPTVLKYMLAYVEAGISLEKFERVVRILTRKDIKGFVKIFLTYIDTIKFKEMLNERKSFYRNFGSLEGIFKMIFSDTINTFRMDPIRNILRANFLYRFYRISSKDYVKVEETISIL